MYTWPKRVNCTRSRISSAPFLSALRPIWSLLPSDGKKRQPTEAEADLIAQADAIRDALIQVDVYEKFPTEKAEAYVRPALVGTEERLAELDRTRFDAVA